jgi:magnesium-transporting ATPase (P-type)
MNKQRKFILIAAAIGLISMFLPWFRVSIFGYSSSVNGMHGSGILVFICFVAAGVLAFLGDQTKHLDKTMWFITLACGALATLIVVWNFIDASSSSYGLGSAISIGFYLAGVAAIAVLVCAYIFRAPGDSIKGGFDSMKKDIEDKTK